MTQALHMGFSAEMYQLRQLTASSTSMLHPVHLNFIHNSAVSATVLNGGALDTCRVQVNNIHPDSSGFQFLQNVSIFINDEASYISNKCLLLQ